jgi:hypothetical protein
LCDETAATKQHPSRLVLSPLPDFKFIIFINVLAYEICGYTCFLSKAMVLTRRMNFHGQPRIGIPHQDVVFFDQCPTPTAAQQHQTSEQIEVTFFDNDRSFSLV